MTSKHYTIHSTRLNRVVNPILRKIQFKTDTPFVIASVFNDEKTEFSHYTIRRIKYDRGVDIKDCTTTVIPAEKEIRKTIKFYLRKYTNNAFFR